MSTRSFIAAAFILTASFTTPLFALADTNCTTTVNGQTVVGIIDPATGACSVSSNVGTNTGTTLINPLNAGTSLESFLNGILAFIIRIGTIVVVLMLIFVGFKFVAAQGSDSKLVEARKMLLWTIIGALVLLGAQAISMGILATVQSLGG